jgi:uncharacterized protein
MTKVIIDTNIHISGFGFGGNAAKIISYCYSFNNFQVFLSTQLFEEIKSKFLDGRLEKIKKDKFDLKKANEFIDNILESSIFIEPIAVFDICRDPKDNMILDLAFEIQADYIITGDEDLLTLNIFEKTKIVKPSEFIEAIEF